MDLHKVTIETTVDPGWIEIVTTGSDKFRNEYLGYWASPVAYLEDGRCILYERVDDSITRKVCQQFEEVEQEFLRSGKLPPRYWVLDINIAKKAWEYGVRRYGEQWYLTGDGPRYDWAIQKALFGETKYG